MTEDLPVIYHARDIEEADLIVGWLEERGVKAVIKNRHSAATLQVPGLAAPEGIEVCAENADQLEHAQQMLKEHFEAEKAARADLPPIDVKCEECGKTTTFKPVSRGRVEDCPHCNAYIDVPE